jgi:hypothetical protein
VPAVTLRPSPPAGADETTRARATGRLLWLAARRVPDDHAVHRLLAGGADGRAAAEAALRHRVGGLLWRALERAGALEVLGEARPMLARAVEVQRLRELLLVPRALELAVPPLMAGGLEPLVLKGPAVAVRYPGPGLRPFDDLDLLLPRRDHAAAVSHLRRAGWELARGPRRDRYDSVLVHPSLPDMPLELHYGLEAWYDRASALQADDVWQRRVSVELFGVPAFGLPVEEEVVVLSAHAAKPYHCFSRLIWVADLAVVVGDAVERGQGVSWEAVADRARAARCTTALAAALSLAALAGTDSPEELRALPRGGWRGEALRRLVEGQWLNEPSPPLHRRFALADGRLRRLLLLFGYTHPMPGLQGLRWRLATAGHAARRWRDLHGGGPWRSAPLPPP